MVYRALDSHGAIHEPNSSIMKILIDNEKPDRQRVSFYGEHGQIRNGRWRLRRLARS